MKRDTKAMRVPLTGSSRRRFGLLGKLARDTKGTSLIEFAAAAPVFLLFVVGIADLGRGFSQRYFLQQAANRTLEVAHFGASGTNFNHLIPEAAAAASVPESNVTLEQWLECDTTRKAFDSYCESGQRTARYVSIEIRASFRPLWGTLGYANANADGTIPIQAKAALRVQ